MLTKSPTGKKLQPHFSQLLLQKLLLQNAAYGIVSCRCLAPETLQVDFWCKFIVSCIHLEFEACVGAGLDYIRTSDITDVGDIYLDIVDAFIAKGRYADAKPMLKALTETEKFDQVDAVFKDNAQHRLFVLKL